MGLQPRTLPRATSAGRGALTGLEVSGSGRSPNVERQAETEDATGVRVGVLYVPSQGLDLREAFENLNVTNETFFQTEVPDAFQMPLAAKLLAMSNTVDVIVAAHGELKEERAEVLRGYQTVALTTNVPIVPFDGKDVASTADKAVQMAEIRQQALLGGGPRRSIFFGIGANKSSSQPKKDKKVYF